jgi:predicted AlkP superfamily pyrophosphatase or phosphodiesterase
MAAAALLLAAAMTAASGCGARYVTADAPSASRLPPPASSITRHVLLVSIDGLRPDAIAAFDAPTLRRLIREGSYTLAARTISPSKTLPSHTSMLTGETPDRHGVFWNTLAGAKADQVALPTVFGAARERGYTTAAFFSKSKFHALQKPGTLDFSQAPRGWFGRWSGARTMKDVEAYLSGAKPNLLFVHLADPDRAGHSDGWMSAAYGRAVTRTDGEVASLLSAADRAFGAGQYSVIVTADHGGHDRDHGSDDPRDMTIPWIAWGRGVRAGELTGLAVRTIDTASTVLWLLGVSEPGDWQGTPVESAFARAE